MIGFWCHPRAGQGVEVDEYPCVIAGPMVGGQAAPPGQDVEGKGKN